VLWRSYLHWLPEMIEVELADNDSVIVRELIHDGIEGPAEWKEYSGKGCIPSSISNVIGSKRRERGATMLRYRLDAVVSMVRDEFDRSRSCSQDVLADGPSGHHVLHARVPKEYRTRIVTQQKEALEEWISRKKRDQRHDPGWCVV